MMTKRDEDKTRDRLIEELRAARSRISELEAAEERYRTIVSSTSDMVLLLDAEDRFVEVHSRPGSALYVSPDVLRGKRHQDLMPPHVTSLYLEAAQQVRSSGKPRSYEYPLQIVGDPMWFTATLNLHDDGQSIVAGIRDITDLRQSEQRLQAVFDSMADYLMLLDREHRIQMINRVERGLQREDVLGTPLYMLVAPDDQARVRAHLDRVVQHTEKQQYNTVYDRPDGSTRHYSSIAAPISVSGRVTGSVVSSRNVTEQIRLEREKDQLEAQYHQAQKMEAIGRLAGGIAHDFNNMLSVIEGNAELTLADLTAGDPLAESMNEIRQATARAADLTRQLLTFSRKQVIAPKVVNLSSLIEGLHPMLVRLIGEDIILRTLPHERIGRVRADPGQIEQIVLNLAINARDAMPGGGELIIETTDENLDQAYCTHNANATPGPHVVLTVSDTGNGMSPEIIEKIFEPFFTTKEIGQGTGLGLATVFGIVEQHGGRIEVHSTPGEGSSFKIYFPRVFEQVDTLARPEKAPPPGGRETVLLVEDEEMVRSLTLKLLRRLGYKVLSAASGGDALVEEERHEGPIDLLLTDVIMPQMNGHDLAERLVKLRPGLKVLYSSGYTQDLIAHHGVLDEEVQFLAKPYSLEGLAAKVRETLDKA